ncbi:hypothetical protein K0M31_016653, partial [Melipona bicolor]
VVCDLKNRLRKQQRDNIIISNKRNFDRSTNNGNNVGWSHYTVQPVCVCITIHVEFPTWVEKTIYQALMNRFEGDEIAEAFKRIIGRTHGIRIDLHWGYCG